MSRVQSLSYTPVFLGFHTGFTSTHRCLVVAPERRPEPIFAYVSGEKVREPVTRGRHTCRRRVRDRDSSETWDEEGSTPETRSVSGSDSLRQGVTGNGWKGQKLESRAQRAHKDTGLRPRYPGSEDP